MAKIAEMWVDEYVKTIGSLTFEVNKGLTGQLSIDIFKSKEDQISSIYPGYNINIGLSDCYHLDQITPYFVQGNEFKYTKSEITKNGEFKVTKEDETFLLNVEETKEFLKFLDYISKSVDERRNDELDKLLNK